VTIRRGGSPRGDDPSEDADSSQAPQRPTGGDSAGGDGMPAERESLRGGGSLRGGPPRAPASLPAASPASPRQPGLATAPGSSTAGGPSAGAHPVDRAPSLEPPKRLALPPLSIVEMFSGLVAPAVAALVLVVVAFISLSILNGQLLTIGGSNGGQPIKTPTPSNLVVVDPRANLPGSLVYVKDGNLWIQSGANARQLTASGSDAMPAFSSDGQWIYFVRTTPAQSHWPADGVLRIYDLQIPALVRIHPDGTGFETMLSGKVSQGGNVWASFIREPSPNPAGTKVAVITDGPNPTAGDLVLKILDLTTGGLVDPRLSEVAPLGHQDPAWSPDGKSILFVKDERSGTRGTPEIERYDLASNRVKALTGPGYISPAWSPDGRFVAATTTSSFGTDIVILDAATGAELLRVTNDDLSFDPVWSPAGDSIVFFRVDHGVVDLELAQLHGTAPAWSVAGSIPLTVSAGLDAASRASWFIPPELIPTPGPSAASSSASSPPFPTLHASTAP
jgi:dipeptidyl aminopeptidase/acylaminoacyl peptidase